MQTLKELLEGARIGKPTAFEVVDILDGETKLGNRLEITLKEDPKPEPRRAESLARAHKLNDVAGLVAYLDRYATGNTVVMACQAQNTIYVVIDETVKTGREVVTVQPIIHPLWAPWRTANGHQMDVDAFLMLLRSHRRTVVAPDSRDLILALSQIEAKTEITLHKGKGKKCLNGLLVRTEIQGTKHEEVVELPETLTLRVPLFVSRKAVDVEVDVTITADPEHSSIHVLLTTDVARLEIEEFDRMLADCADALKTKKIVFALGAASYTPWHYLP